MLHRRALPFALLFTLIAVGPLGAQSPEIESLRTKAEKGNSIAQYNLGLAYQAGRDVNADWPEAFVWLTLAAENGTTGKALQNLVAVMTPAQLAEGQSRLTAERGRQLALAQTNLDLANEQIDQLKQTEVKLQTELAATSKPVEPDPALTQQITQLEAELKMAQQATATAQSQAAQQQSRADQQAGQLNRLRGELAARNNQIRSNDERIAALQSELTAAQTTSNQPNPDAAVIAKLRTEITALNTSLADMQNGRSELTAQVDSLSSDLGSARVQVAGLKSDNENLSRQLATATRPVTSDPADAAKITSRQSDLARVRQQLADARTAGSMAEEQSATLGNLRDEVARLQTELKQTSAAQADSEAQAQTLAAELAEAKNKLTETKTLLAATASTPAAEDDDTELGALQSKLSTALNSYTILQEENDSLKTSTEQLTMRINQLEGQLAIANNATEDLSTQLDTTSANAARAAALREQLRQTSDQLGTSRREAAELRTRIAIITPPPSSNYAAPTRPGSAAAATVIAEAAPPPAPVAISTARTHKVVSGDTLSGIALRYYGTPVRWAEIYEANRAKLPNERALRIGMELLIP